MTAAPRVACAEVHELAEGPFWDPGHGILLWVDIHRGLVLAGELDDDGGLAITERTHVDTTVGAVAAAADGGRLVAGAEALLTWAPGGEPRPFARLLAPGSGRRLNDGKPDPSGRYLVGTLSPAGPTESEQLFAVDAAGAVRVLDDDLTLANGLAWTRDGRRMYSVDTARRRVDVRDYDPATGDAGPRAAFVVLDDGYPDGICLDAEEHLWVAVWGRGEVHRYTPDGILDRVVRVPAPHVSSVAFAGAGLRTLVVTTARSELTSEQIAAWPDSGRIFTLDPGVAGLPQPLWGGITLTEKDS